MRTILITGVSSGFGQCFAKEALRRGYRVVGTVRTLRDLESFHALPGSTSGYCLDVSDEAAIFRTVAEIERDIAPIDVLINNAGYGVEGVLEEVDQSEIRRQFDVNLFAPIALMKAVLPSMRARRQGHIVNVSSMGGLITFPGLGVYHGSKFALEGISEALAKEVAGLGIHVTLIEPGAFRTRWAGGSLLRAPRSVSDYDEVFEPQRKVRRDRSGQQPGDPGKAAQAVMDCVDSDQPPLRLLLGSDAVNFVRQKLTMLQQEIDRWEAVSVSTDY